MLSDTDRVQVLSEALPYIQAFAGKTIVVKYGGAAMKDETLKAEVIRDIVFMAAVGLKIVVVHGGGPEINLWLNKLGIEAQFKNGLRVTDAPTMDVVEMVLVGRVNKELVSLISQAGGAAVGICGKDGNLVMARPQGEAGIGFVGEVNAVNSDLISTLLDGGYIPIVSSVADDETGQPYNINADTVAGELAASLEAEKLILLTDTAGILQDAKDPSTLIPQLSIGEARSLIETEIVAGGMIPKVLCCVRSLAQGVNAAHIIDGQVPHALLLEIFTDAGVGSMITA
ncbi:MAG: acetylglutamate kinase [Thermosynechococcaceae cyanobacterium]